MTTTRSRLARLGAAGVVALALSACAAPSVPADSPAFTPAAATPVPTLAKDTCDNPRQSFDPYPSVAAGMAARTSLQAAILQRGKLVVGVSGDSKLLGARVPGDPTKFEGFDIDLANAVARAIFGPGGEKNVQFRVITAAQRIPLVNEGAAGGGVDLVARNMTMNCSRWKDVNFSATYFEARQQVLVSRDSGLKAVTELGPAKARVCAPAGSTSIQRIAHDERFTGIVPVEVDQHTTCLALLQQGRVDAVTGDSTVLAGLRVQDPRFTTIFDDSLATEPYGLAVAKSHPEFARFLNAVLAKYIADGDWQKSYDTWFKTPLQQPGVPPKPQYGRQ